MQQTTGKKPQKSDDDDDDDDDNNYNVSPFVCYFFPAVVAVTAAHVACVRHSSARAGQREERRPARHGSHTQLPQAAQPASSL